MKSIAKGIAFAGMAVLTIATPAYAANKTASVTGSTAYSLASSNFNYFHVKDTACDGKGAYGRASMSTGGVYRLNNNSGCSTDVAANPTGYVSAVQACLDYPLGGDNCSSWRG